MMRSVFTRSPEAITPVPLKDFLIRSFCLLKIPQAVAIKCTNSWFVTVAWNFGFCSQGEFVSSNKFLEPPFTSCKAGIVLNDLLFCLYLNITMGDGHLQVSHFEDPSQNLITHVVGVL